jgi:hypothetical protein
MVCSLVLAGCGKPEARSEKAPAAAGHVHVAPHGGTLVEVGEHQFNLEFLFDESRGVLQAWFLDAHAENFVRVALPDFEVAATSGGKNYALTFAPVANAVTGETAGDTAQFEAAAPWLRDAKAFDGVVKAITVRGVSFSGIAFDFPLNHDDHDHAKEHAH